MFGFDVAFERIPKKIIRNCPVPSDDWYYAATSSEILIWYDQPLMWVSTYKEQKYLVNSIDINDVHTCSLMLITQITQQDLDDLKSDKLSTLDAFTRNEECYLQVVCHPYNRSFEYLVKIADVPEIYLPTADAMLHYDMYSH